MKRLFLGVSALGLIGFLSGGCSHIQEARADYHEGKAKREARRGNYGKAIEEERKAIDAREDAYDAKH